MPHYNLPHNHGQNMERVLNKMPHTEDFTDIAFLFQQLGDPTRLRILWLLCHCDECVCNIAAAVDMSAPAVSHHLRILKKSGIISSRRDGKEVYYSLADTPQAKLLHRSIADKEYSHLHIFGEMEQTACKEQHRRHKDACKQMLLFSCHKLSSPFMKTPATRDGSRWMAFITP